MPQIKLHASKIQPETMPTDKLVCVVSMGVEAEWEFGPAGTGKGHKHVQLSGKRDTSLSVSLLLGGCLHFSTTAPSMAEMTMVWYSDGSHSLCGVGECTLM